MSRRASLCQESETGLFGTISASHRFRKHVTITVAANGVIAVFGFTSGVLAARLLGPSRRGELAAIQTVSSLLATFATLGLPEAVVLYCARDPRNAGRYVSSALTLGLLLCVPLLVLCYMAMPYLLASQTAQIVTAARWYLLIAIVFIAVGGPHAALRGLSDFVSWNAIRLVPGTVWIAILCFAWITGVSSPSFLALLNLVALTAVASPIVFWVVRSRIKGSYLPDLGTWLPMIRFGMPSALSGVPQTLNLRLDQMLMAALLPARLLGLYAVAVAWSGMMSPLLQAVSSVIFPHIASHTSVDEQSRTLLRIVRLASPLALGLAVGLALVTKWSLPLVFGHSFQASIPSALVLIAAGAVLSVVQLLEEGLRGMGSPMSILWSELGGLIVTAISLLCLLKPMNIMGAAISSLLGYTAVCGLLLFHVSFLTGFSVRSIFVPTLSELHQGWARVRILFGRVS